METLAQRILRLRSEAGLEQEDLAEKAGVGYGSVQKWEQGKVNSITMKMAIKLSKVLPATPEEIKYGKESPLSTLHAKEAPRSSIPGEFLDDLIPAMEYLYQNDFDLYSAVLESAQRAVTQLKREKTKESQT